MTTTGHPLIDRAPTSWRRATVDEVKSGDRHACVAGPFGSSISSKYFTAEGVPIIRGSNLTVDLERFVARDFAFVSEETAKRFAAQTVRANDLVFTCWGTIGQVGLIPNNGPFDRYVISNKQLKLRVDPDVLDPLFAYYFFASPETVQYVRDRAIGAAVPGINLGILKSLPVLVPPLAIQRRIAAILGAYDDLIEVNRRRVAVLEDMAQGLFEEWFVRFRYPGHQDVHADNGADKSLPPGWKSVPLGTVARNVRTKYEEGGSDVTRLLDLSRIPRRSNLVSEFGDPSELSTSRIIAQTGDVLFAGIRPNLWKVVTAPCDVVTNVSVHVVRSLKEVPQSYLWGALFRDFAVAWASQHANGTKMPTLNWKTLSQFPIILPESSVLSQFDKVVSPPLKAISAFVLANQSLAASRDLLLPRLISGQLSVEAAERELEDAA
ncbi:restriction endonuclease subunit S [Erythrobacter neustonensis]|uniref:Type I restriction modification DNA specificity domain-containing protein n=1 Tax=Erythrobacter neustonensis TaxID=1112 RepID=A0A192D2Q8_9SPHN|nr:restriction endonuclease subunit S [Erythrobacter neustonensis]ANK12768.1 hypothetical protein A9D12_07225 [Erythrobacter neustonensis]